MAHIFKREKYWWLADGTGKNRICYSLKTGDKRLAERILAKYNEEKVLRRFGLPVNNGNIYLKELVPEYLTTVKRAISDRWHKRQVQIFNHFQKYIGDVQIKDLTPRDMNTYINSRLDKVSPRTVLMEYKVIKKLLDFAVDSGYIPDNPAGNKSVVLPKVEKKRFPGFDKSILRDLFSQAGKYTLYYKTLLYTGLRAADAANLHSDQIQGDIIHIKTAKTGTETEIFIHSEIKEIQNSDGLIFMEPGESSTHYVDRAYKYLKKIIKSNNWNRELTLHSFRVTYNNILRDAGVSFDDRKILMTHSASKVTADYTRKNRELSQALIEKIKI